MKKRFTEAQIVGFLRAVDAGIPVKELCRRHGFSEASCYLWRSRFGGMTVADPGVVSEYAYRPRIAYSLNRWGGRGREYAWATDSVLSVPVRACRGLRCGSGYCHVAGRLLVRRGGRHGVGRAIRVLWGHSACACRASDAGTREKQYVQAV